MSNTDWCQAQEDESDKAHVGSDLDGLLNLTTAAEADAATKIQAALRGKIVREKLIRTMDYFAEKYIWKIFNAANDEVTRQNLCDEPSDPNENEEEMSWGMETMMTIRQFMDDTYAREREFAAEAQERESAAEAQEPDWWLEIVREHPELEVE